jgi:hypothetical protein
MISAAISSVVSRSCSKPEVQIPSKEKKKDKKVYFSLSTLYHHERAS